MTAPGRKARKLCGDQGPICTRPVSWGSGTALLESEPNRPPRLCRKDLKEPERFHHRLVEWLLKQR